MPFYDLRCSVCQSEFNVSANIADKTNKSIPCPDCGSFELETVFKSAPAYIKSRKDIQCPNQGSCGGCSVGMGR